ncbi:MAG: DUF2442 domain-containing protein, partial [Tannerella sp.]|nr:DUF2442 domain-containing protein [Tannerella sp.]
THLAHKSVFRAWDVNDLFRHVHIDDFGAVAWSDDIDLCPDSLYLQLKGLTFEQWQQETQRNGQPSTEMNCWQIGVV